MTGTDAATDSKQTLEEAALAGAAAIKQIIDERDRLRRVTQSQQAEIDRLRVSDEDSRRRIIVIRQHYLKLATEILSKFEKFDGAVRDALDEPYAEPSPKNQDTAPGVFQHLAPTVHASGTESARRF